ncbi:hypothetical protein [Brevundimonas sp. PAMC22021]|uniref:hypothetical protein n=1 Tax=Brevundimonas sp. PAMC22021 TaxID=2861285 RepID=UPI002106EDF5|nr:hypothetical protein [Brevundimonas sp. PAMC22021]
MPSTFPALSDALKGALAAILVAAPALFGAAVPAAAQDTQSQIQRNNLGRQQDTERQERGNRRDRRAAPAAAPTQTPEEARAGAQAALTAAGSSCQVTEATLRGQTADKTNVYEAICAAGPGFIVVTSTPPQASDCVLLAASAEAVRAKDPAADVGTVCTLPANQNAQAVIFGYAKEAGVSCQVDQGVLRGQSSAGKPIYEIGCVGSDGAWIEQTADNGWDVTPCLQLGASGQTCNFTTADEQNADVKKLLAGTPGEACDVQQIRLMGQNARGTFMEAKCAAADTGYVVRVSEGVVGDVYTCAEAAHIGGGCTLTTAAAAAPATTEN